MTLHKSCFTTLIYISILFIMFTTAEQNKVIVDCLNSMKEYCKSTTNSPTSFFCILEAIDNWLDAELPNGCVKEYYLSFGKTLNTDGVKSPKDYCRLASNKLKCKNDLKPFGETNTDAVLYALYSTKSNNYKPNEDNKSSPETDFGYTYLAHIKRRVTKGTAKEPQDFCKNECAGEKL